MSISTQPVSQNNSSPGKHRSDRRAGQENTGSALLDRLSTTGGCTERFSPVGPEPVGSRLGDRWSAWTTRLDSWSARLRIDRRTRRLLAVILLLVGLVAAVSAWLSWPRSEPASLAVAVSQTRRADAVAEPITVTVAGDVVRPGLVELPTGSRVADAVSAAGGLIPEATSAGYLNLARKVADGELIIVEAVGDGDPGSEDPGGAGADPALPAPGEPGDAGAGPAAPVNLNQATLADLDALPGIGPVMAQRILDYRQDNGGFDSVDQLQDVSGIGPATAAKLADLVAV